MPIPVHRFLVGARNSAGFEGHCWNRFSENYLGTAGTVPDAVQILRNKFNKSNNWSIIVPNAIQSVKLGVICIIGA